MRLTPFVLKLDKTYLRTLSPSTLISALVYVPGPGILLAVEAVSRNRWDWENTLAREFLMKKVELRID
jgi:hypothetical protein